ncbi:transglutaminase-like cysteine peptidase [Bradyrhizobium sp.]|uniref:transglutaminase-like cysteine peptidase n=1 Tax=Bradyrhizobium sp. TaxID=376 RepID=UPI0025C3C062|nr:transglutaminase-like cysteine peptidase [Bradyrhizobium sp.]
MARLFRAFSLLLALGGSLFSTDAHARDRFSKDTYASIAEASPTLAPFQHVRFCLRYPSECNSNPAEAERIDLSAENLELLRRVNSSVNASISPEPKRYGADLQDGWTIAPASGDCNDYAITKRHNLLKSGLPAKALRLSAVKTSSGIGHLVLVVATTKGDMVLDNLTESIRPWQNTDYRWVKIQSATDARFWYEVRTAAAVAQSGPRVRLADR